MINMVLGSSKGIFFSNENIPTPIIAQFITLKTSIQN